MPQAIYYSPHTYINNHLGSSPLNVTTHTAPDRTVGRRCLFFIALFLPYNGKYQNIYSSIQPTIHYFLYSLFNFTDHDAFGSSKVVLYSEGLAICIDRNILTITSILIVTGNSDMQVTHSYEGNEVRLNSNPKNETAEGVTDSTFVTTNEQTKSTTNSNHKTTNKDEPGTMSNDTDNKHE